MKIISYDFFIIKIPFKKHFVHAKYARYHTDAVIIKLVSSCGCVGFGEILPREYVTGESIGSVINEVLPKLMARIIGIEFLNKSDIINLLQYEIQHVGRNFATFCGVETAILDLAGKVFSFSVGNLLGPIMNDPLPGGTVIGFEMDTEVLSRYCTVLKLKGKKNIKVKVGHSDDKKRLSIIYDILKVPLRIDSNGIWKDFNEAEKFLSSLNYIEIESVEQPLPTDDINGARRIRNELGFKVMADESICSFNDAKLLIDEEAVDVFNIRIGKCGGLLEAKKIVNLAKQHNIDCSLGTLVGETGILSRCSEIFGQCIDGFYFLDGKGQNISLLVDDIVNGLKKDVADSADYVGLGITVSEESIRKYSVII